jgi:uridylate kinase
MNSYKRILLKLSGESLAGSQKSGIDDIRLKVYAKQIAEVANMGVQIAIVAGGGNIFRGINQSSAGIERVTGDQMGMLATVINSLALAAALSKFNTKSKVFTSIRMEPVGEFYTKQKAIDSLSKGEIAIIAGGTGNPYFTTDTASVLRALETEADIMLKGTRVDGVFSADPEKDPDPEKFDKISFDEVYARQLRVMDLTASTLCRENNLQVLVFNMDKEGNLKKIIEGKNTGTLIY